MLTLSAHVILQIYKKIFVTFFWHVATKKNLNTMRSVKE